MKVYRAPASVGEPPDLSIWTSEGRERYEAVEAEWLTKLRLWCKSTSRHRLAGKVVRIPYADSCAQYMVLDGRSLIHLPLGDAWNVPDYMTRGLRVADIERMAS